MRNAKVSPAQIQKKLDGVDYPASKQDLIDHVKNSEGNNKEVIQVMDQLPDKDYNSPVDVSKAVGQID